jgi:hypothetical protein
MRLLGNTRTATLFSRTLALWNRRAAWMRSSVLASSDCRCRKLWLAFRSGSFSAAARSDLSECVGAFSCALYPWQVPAVRATYSFRRIS